MVNIESYSARNGDFGLYGLIWWSVWVMLVVIYIGFATRAYKESLL